MRYYFSNMVFSEAPYMSACGLRSCVCVYLRAVVGWFTIYCAINYSTRL